MRYVSLPIFLSAVFTAFVPSAKAAAATASLSWTASTSPGIAGYTVYYGVQRGDYSFAAPVGNVTTAKISGLLDGVTYYFAVTASDNSGVESKPSNEATFSVPGIASPSSAPIGLQLQPDGGATLHWNPSPSSDVAGYYVYYGTQSGEYSGVVWAGDIEATIYGLAGGETYFFAVSALDSSGQESTRSPEASFAVAMVAPPSTAPAVLQSLPNQGLTLSWNSSSSPNAAGYIVYYGDQSGLYNNAVWAGDSEQVDIYGLVDGVTYYFVVTAYDNFGQQSTASPELSFTTVAVPDPGPVLSLTPIALDGFANAFSISASGTLPSVWTLEASSDLTTWRPLTSGDASSFDVTVVISLKPQLFFRLNSSYTDIELQLQKDAANGYPNSFSVTTAYSIPWSWTLEASDDLQTWTPFIIGFFSPLNLAIVTAPTPAMFFRLKGG